MLRSQFGIAGTSAGMHCAAADRRSVSVPVADSCFDCCLCCSSAADFYKKRDGPKALDEFCRDLCEEVRMNKIDPVSRHWTHFRKGSAAGRIHMGSSSQAIN